jgi:hypothetical protein
MGDIGELFEIATSDRARSMKHLSGIAQVDTEIFGRSPEEIIADQIPLRSLLTEAEVVEIVYNSIRARKAELEENNG